MGYSDKVHSYVSFKFFYIELFFRFIPSQRIRNGAWFCRPWYVLLYVTFNQTRLMFVSAVVHDVEFANVPMKIGKEQRPLCDGQ